MPGPLSGRRRSPQAASPPRQAPGSARPTSRRCREGGPLAPSPAASRAVRPASRLCASPPPAQSGSRLRPHSCRTRPRRELPRSPQPSQTPRNRHLRKSRRGSSGRRPFRHRLSGSGCAHAAPGQCPQASTCRKPLDGRQTSPARTRRRSRPPGGLRCPMAGRGSAAGRQSRTQFAPPSRRFLRERRPSAPRAQACRDRDATSYGS